MDTSPARADTSWTSTAELTTNMKIAVIQTVHEGHFVDGHLIHLAAGGVSALPRSTG